MVNVSPSLLSPFMHGNVSTILEEDLHFTNQTCSVNEQMIKLGDLDNSVHYLVRLGASLKITSPGLSSVCMYA